MHPIAIIILIPLIALAFQWWRTKNQAFAWSSLVYLTFLGSLSRPSGIPIPTVYGAFLVFFVLSSKIRSHKGIGYLHKADFLSVVLFSWIAFMILLNGSMDETRLLQGSANIILILASTKLTSEFSEKDIKIVLGTAVFGSFIVSIFCLIQAFVSPNLFGLVVLNPHTIRGRMVVFESNPNATAFYLLIGFCLSLGISTTHPEPLNKRLIVRLSTISVSFLTLWSIVLTGSRSAFSGAIFASFIFLVSRAKSIVTLFMAMVSLLFLLVLGEPLIFLESTLFPNRPDFTSFGRENRWSIGFDIIASSPIFGDASVLFNYKPIVYHNDFLQLAASYGIPAALVFSLIIIYSIKRIKNSQKIKNCTPIQISIILLVAGQIVNSWFHGLLLSGICFWTIIGIAINNHKMYSNPRPQKGHT